MPTVELRLRTACALQVVNQALPYTTLRNVRGHVEGALRTSTSNRLRMRLGSVGADVNVLDRLAQGGSN